MRLARPSTLIRNNEAGHRIYTMKQTTITIRISEKEKKQAEKLSKLEKRSLSDLIRVLLQERYEVKTGRTGT